MDANLIVSKFQRMGARAQVRDLSRSAPAERLGRSNVRIDVIRDAEGECFDIAYDSTVTRLDVLDLRASLRHLVLLARSRDGGRTQGDGGKFKFLCGHDERAWFAAAVPERGAVSSVRDAFEALKPAAVRFQQDRVGLRRKGRNRRRNRAFVRQGEWFFLRGGGPRPGAEGFVLRNEPLRRGAGKSHLAEFCYRERGEPVYVSTRFPNGLTPGQHREWLRRNPWSKLRWTLMQRNATVYVKGRIRHPDHSTVFLREWHLVVPNAENESTVGKFLAYLD